MMTTSFLSNPPWSLICVDCETRYPGLGRRTPNISTQSGKGPKPVVCAGASIPFRLQYVVPQYVNILTRDFLLPFPWFLFVVWRNMSS